MVLQHGTATYTILTVWERNYLAKSEKSSEIYKSVVRIRLDLQKDLLCQDFPPNSSHAFLLHFWS